VSHAADDDDLPAEQAKMVEDYQRSTTVPFVHRDPEVIAGWLDGMELVPPGIVLTNQWHPDTDAEPILRTFGVLARKVDWGSVSGCRACSCSGGPLPLW
jgi:hypothetical protein